MRGKRIVLLIVLVLACSMLTGCGLLSRFLKLREQTSTPNHDGKSAVIVIKTSGSGVGIDGEPLEEIRRTNELLVYDGDYFSEDVGGSLDYNSTPEGNLVVLEIEKINDDSVVFKSAGVEYEVSYGASTVINSMWCVDDGRNFTYEIIFKDEMKMNTGDDKDEKTGDDTKPDTTPSTDSDNYNITVAESAQINMVSYTQPEGWFTMDIPEGWQVYIGFPNGMEYDLISYPITVYDPYNTNRKIHFTTSSVVMTSDIYKQLWGNSITAQYMVVDDFTSQGIWSTYGEYQKDNDWGFKNFSIEENLGSYYNGEAVVATCTSYSTGSNLRGIFGIGGVHEEPVLQTLMLNQMTFITAGEDEFTDWAPVMLRSLESLRFTDQFEEYRQRHWSQLIGNSTYMASLADAETQMLADSWEARNRSYDILSQKQSDATMGYERVYDVETGYRYKAEQGFLDSYSGDRFLPATDDMYADPVQGYITR